MGSRSRLKIDKPIHSPYLKHIPLLIIALLCLFWTLNIVITRNPEEVANWVITQAYIPIITPFFLFITFLSGYITLNMRRGGVIGIFITMLLLFRLQQISFESWWLVPFFIIFIVFVISAKKNNEKSNPHSKKISDYRDEHDI